jgi:hypothetical protein
VRPVLDQRRFNRSVGLGRMHNFQDLRDKVSGRGAKRALEKASHRNDFIGNPVRIPKRKTLQVDLR